MRSTEPEDAAARLDAAIRAGAYRRCGKLLEDFRAAVQSAVAAAPEQAAGTLASARTHLEQMRAQAICNRAQLASELEDITRARAYLPPHRRRGLEVSG
jgi:hypothetical protein